MPLLWILAALVFGGASHAAPLSHSLGDTRAVKAGTLTVGLPSYPRGLLYYLAYDEMADAITSLILEPLVGRTRDSFEPYPLLAKSWAFSPDQKQITFQLRPNARFSDEKPVTADDVVFTWQVINDPKNLTAPFQAYFSSFSKCEALGPHTVRFTVRTPHFRNLEKLSELKILPRHFFVTGDFNKDFQTRLLGSGPYQVEEARPGERVVLRRNPAYWGQGLSENTGRYNFDKIIFLATADPAMQFELFKRGEIDYFYFTVSKMWEKDTDGVPFRNHYIQKLKGENQIPYGTSGLAWNLRKPLFKDAQVRQALAHLMNREKIVADLFYNNYVLSTGIVPPQSTYHSPQNAPLAFDPKRAAELLAKAGWKRGTDGILTKAGQRFAFELITDSSSALRYLNIFQEEFLRAGIQMQIRVLDWSTRLKLVDSREFDAADVSRTREIVPSDFCKDWSSKQARLPASANIVGYENPKADKLCAEIDTESDARKRAALVRRLDQLIGADQPIAFTWEPTYFRIGYWDKFSFPGRGYFNYSSWRNAFEYWWYDAARAERLKTAMEQKKPLS